MTSTRVGQPLANYLACKRIGDIVYMSGVIAVDPASRSVVTRYEQLPQSACDELATLGWVTGQMSVDIHEAPVVAQSWFVLDRIRQIATECGGSMDDVFKLVQYFADLRDYPLYNRVRGLFYPGVPPVSTVVEVSGMLPAREVRIEVEATACIPLPR
jgi:2-iminobutanoate/2-iminopropanoate deaminase